MPGELAQVQPANRAGWRAWLASHHESVEGVRLVLAKKDSGAQRLSLDAAVEEALCFGWIDSTLHPVDDHRFAVTFTPRRPGSTWSRWNRARIESLTARGRMTDAGLRAVERAQQDGSWTALDEVDQLRVPDDLAAALAAEPVAQRNFDRFTASARKAALWWIRSAMRPQTRAMRIAETVRLAADNRTVLQR